MGAKMTFAFAVTFVMLAHIEKQLLAISPHKPLIWKRFIDDLSCYKSSFILTVTNYNSLEALLLNVQTIYLFG